MAAAVATRWLEPWRTRSHYPPRMGADGQPLPPNRRPFRKYDSCGTGEDGIQSFSCIELSGKDRGDPEDAICRMHIAEDLDVKEFLLESDSQFAGANNGKGVNSREKIHFMGRALEKNGIRLKAWDMAVKKARDSGELHADPAGVFAKLVKILETIIPEDKLEKKLRKKLEFDTYEQGKLHDIAFHLKFTEMLEELKDMDGILMSRTST